MKSMTGYGRASFEVAEFCGSVEFSTVNKRGFELVLHAPREWQSMERQVTELVRPRIDRGRTRLSVLVDNSSSSSKGWLQHAGYVSTELESIKKFCQDAGIPFSPSADLVQRIASSINGAVALPPIDSALPNLLQSTEIALGEALEMRKVEGKALKEDLSRRTNLLKSLILEIGKETDGAATEWKKRLITRLKENGLEIGQDDERVAKEIAIFAERADVTEELTRTSSHLHQFATCLESDEPIGRKLEFITQELGREFNTLGSKAVKPSVSELAIQAKVELEKIREQVMNVE